MDTETRKAIINALTQIRVAKNRLEEAEMYLRDLMTDLCVPVVPNAQLDVGR